MEASNRVQSLKLNLKFIAGEFEIFKITAFIVLLAEKRLGATLGLNVRILLHSF